VMGIGYTIDTPLKVAQYGIDSVISLVDDMLLEKLRKMYCEKYQIPYEEISEKIEDFRAKRITSYLNLMNDLVKEKFEELKTAAFEKGNELKKYLEMLPDTSAIKQEFLNFDSSKFSLEEVGNWLKKNLSMGSIDVNIMTKVDKENYWNKEKLLTEFNDAHAALRGFANSDLASSVTLSAGMNPRLYSYIENFEDFYPNENGEIKKKIVLKVSDYRSALIQGKFLAKKGLWVSEYRIESGLNCGGHAFATEGFLLGPVLDEFKTNKNDLIQSIQTILINALVVKNKTIPNADLSLKITAQGGVGTSEEHDFLLDYYGIDSVGWGSPFLLVPEVTSVDDATLEKLAKAKEADLYLSNISPLGIPFNRLKGNTKDAEKQALIDKGRPGSSCPKKYVQLNKEFGDKALCTASRQYQYLKLQALDSEELSEEKYQAKFNEITEKSCICVGLGTSSLLKYGLDTRTEKEGVSVCSGPNIAYFSQVTSLQSMINHIYGRENTILRTDRPNMFVKDLNIYLDYFKTEIFKSVDNLNRKQEKYLKNFGENLDVGIEYYSQVFENATDKFNDTKTTILNDLEKGKAVLKSLITDVEQLIGKK
jgi:hypothetical protein